MANLPCRQVYIPLGSQPLAQSYIGYIDVTCVLPIVHPKNSLQVHDKNSSAPTPYHTTSPGTAYTKFSCLRKSLDGASLFVSAIAIQLTPSYTSYITHYFQTIEESSDAAW